MRRGKGLSFNAEAPRGGRNCHNVGFQEGRVQNLGLVRERGGEEADMEALLPSGLINCSLCC